MNNYKSCVSKVYIGDTLNVHIRLKGYLEKIIEAMIAEGIAANKTEAIRAALLFYNEHYKLARRESEEESLRKAVSSSNQDIWQDEKEDKIWRKYL